MFTTHLGKLNASLFKPLVNLSTLKLIRNLIRRSNSHKGNCWDNSGAKSFFVPLKREMEYNHFHSLRECEYLAIYCAWVTGTSSTDHFVTKSKNTGEAYEWNNYRLSCLGANRSKNKFDDLIDPIGLAGDTFVLNFSTGSIKPNASLITVNKSLAKKTIARLKLNSAKHKKMRARHFSEYLKHQGPDILKLYSPFVWYEASRQGLL